MGFTVWGAASLCLVLGFTAVTVKRMVAREPDLVVKRILVFGLFGKFAASAAYWFVISDVYEGGDSLLYVREGERIAAMLRDGVIPENAWDTGTRSMEFVSGAVFALSQPTVIHGFVIFALLAYLGAVLAFKAFTLGFPEGDRRRYAALVLLLPSMLFWPSSISKDSWLIFCLGVGMYGAARLLRRLPRGYVLLAAGTAGVYLIRPHMGALLAVAAAAAFAIRFRDPDTRSGALAWLVGLVLVVAGTGFVLANFADELLPQDQLIEGSRVQALLDKTEEQTAIGGSEFEARPVDSIQDFPAAAVTVVFRPFPWEAPSATGLVASIEGFGLLVLTLLSLPRLVRLPRTVLRRPWVGFAAAYTVGFIIAFAAIGNFGILARQRVQLLPFFLVLLCVPKPGSSSEDQPSAADGIDQHHGPLLTVRD